MAEKLPKYMEVVKWVKERIESKELNAGDKLYSENQLSSMLSMSRQTIRHGISKLEQAGIVESVQGSGTYITNNKKKKKEKTLNIAVVTTYVDRYIFPSVIKEIERVISEAGFFTQIAFTNNTQEGEYSILKKFLDNNVVDGIIIEPTKSALPNPNIKLYHEIIEEKLPLIFINSYYPQLDLPYVAMDDKKAGLLAVNHLIEAGHTKIAAIFKFDDLQGHLRYSGYMEGMQEAKLTVYDDNIIWIDTEDINHMKDNETRVLNRIKDCTACVCYNDELAISMIDICKSNNINIPEQLSLVSIDDSHLATLSELPLTSVANPVKELGEKAAENLLKTIQNYDFNGNYKFSPTISIRDSVKKI